MMPYNIEVKALGLSSSQIVTKYENLRNYLQGNFLSVVQFLATIELSFTSGNDAPKERCKQWVVSTSRKSEMVTAINILDKVGKEYKVAGTIPVLEYLIMACGVEMVDGQVMILSRRKNDELMEKLNANRIEGNLCDVEIMIDGEKFSAHKFVVATLSSYFAERFKDGQSTVEITDIGKVEFSSIIEFLYTGELLIKHDQFTNLQMAAKLINIECLTKALKIYLTLQEYKKPPKKQLSVPLVVVAKTEIPEGGWPQSSSTTEWENLSASEGHVEIPPKKPQTKQRSYGKRKEPPTNDDTTIELGRSKRKVKANPKYNDYLFAYRTSVKQEIVEVTYNSDEDNEFPEEKFMVVQQDEEEEYVEEQEETETFPCQICNKRFTRKKYLKSHMASHKGTKPVIESSNCPLCHKKLDDKVTLKTHLQEAHSSEQVDYICGIGDCSQTFDSYEDLKQHKDDAHADTAAALVSQEGATNQSENGEIKVIGVLSQNANGKLSVEYKKVLQPRKKTFVTRVKNLPSVSSIKKEAPTRFPCKICVKVFQSAHALEKHEARHNDTYRFFCPYCPKKYYEKHYLTKHMLTHDEAYTKEYMCAICNQTFKIITELERHVINHMEENDLFLDDGEDLGDDEFKCVECKKQMQGRENFIKHKILHTDKKPFKCVQCHDQFKQVDVLRKHIRVSHFETLGGNTKSSWYYERELVECNKCSKKMQRKSLKDHMYTHVTDESLLPPNWKKHKCMFCDKNFRSRGHLERHLRGHTGEKPFMCDICGKSYATADFVQNHISKTHIEAKFFCDVCGKACKTEGALRAHRFVFNQCFLNCMG